MLTMIRIGDGVPAIITQALGTTAASLGRELHEAQDLLRRALDRSE